MAGTALPGITTVYPRGALDGSPSINHLKSNYTFRQCIYLASVPPVSLEYQDLSLHTHIHPLRDFTSLCVSNVEIKG